MAQPKSDGGAAFPRVCSTPSDFAWPGMSLRDYFAGQALAGMFAIGEERWLAEQVAESAYVFADAMISARDA